MGVLKAYVDGEWRKVGCGTPPNGMGYPAMIVADGPYAYWRMEDPSGPVSDSSGNGRSTAAPSGSATQQIIAGALAGGWSLDVGTGWVEYTPAATVDGTWTVELWAHSSDTRAQQVMGSRSPNEYGFDLQLQASLGGIHCDIGDGSAWLTTAADASFTWDGSGFNHVVLAVTPTTWKVYYNGSLANSGSLSGAPLLMDANHRLRVGHGGSGGTLGLVGQIDEVAIYDYELTSTQVADHYAEALIVEPGRLKLWDGSQWLREKCDGDVGTARPLKLWDGSAWVNVACMVPTYVDTYSDSY